MSSSPAAVREVSEMIRKIIDLPEDFHEAGVMSGAVLEAMAAHASGLDVHRSAETGCGKSTLLFSWISEDHTTFTLSHYGEIPCESYNKVKDSNLLNPGIVHFELGSSQVTLPEFSFEEPLQIALIDGPHGFPFPQMEYYCFYPNIQEGGLLILDDIHIPTVGWLNDFLVEDEMFDCLEAVESTAFFRRTSAPTFNPFGDDWWLQNYNRSRMPAEDSNYRFLPQFIQDSWKRLFSRT